MSFIFFEIHCTHSFFHIQGTHCVISTSIFISHPRHTHCFKSMAIFLSHSRHIHCFISTTIFLSHSRQTQCFISTAIFLSHRWHTLFHIHENFLLSSLHTFTLFHTHGKHSVNDSFPVRFLFWLLCPPTINIPHIFLE